MARAYGTIRSRVSCSAMHILAYLDPGSGNMILQVLAGGAAAVAVAARLYWNRILKFLRIKKDDEVVEQKQVDSA